MDPTRRPTVTEGVVVCLTAMAIAALMIGGGRLLWEARPSQADPPQGAEPAPAALEEPRSDKQADEPRLARAKAMMIEADLAGRDITDARVLEAMGKVPRHRFVADEMVDQAYGDYPLPIGHGQTISQPYIVALMTQLTGPKPESRALDIGTGSGYQAAVLAGLSKEVYSIEIVKPLADEAKKRLADLGYKNVTVRAGDGYRGWPEKAPFDVIIVAAAPDHVPQPLVDQLAPGGRMVIPVGKYFQELLLLEKDRDGKVERKSIVPVSFVPMTGEAQKQNP